MVSSYWTCLTVFALLVECIEDWWLCLRDEGTLVEALFSQSFDSRMSTVRFGREENSPNRDSLLGKAGKDLLTSQKNHFLNPPNHSS
ncbi:Hypothetical protein NTJ_05303 [Nesidiocoris tenuis]|uniref:Secreted protein n=1 Tax=Nesidiocoris tenuis TaxID=355587 RepID=A0ABN7AM43_9HEMI|nr:Hypothetical protein NTJ_05303 [Nesidiocoris tenuis]